MSTNEKIYPGGVRTYPTDTAGTIRRGDRVKLNTAGDAVELAGVDDHALGIALRPNPNGEDVAVQFPYGADTCVARASEAVTAGAQVYSAANGEVDVDDQTGHLVGRAISAAGAADDLFEIIYVEELG